MQLLTVKVTESLKAKAISVRIALRKSNAPKTGNQKKQLQSIYGTVILTRRRRNSMPYVRSRTGMKVIFWMSEKWPWP